MNAPPNKIQKKPSLIHKIYHETTPLFDDLNPSNLEQDYSSLYTSPALTHSVSENSNNINSSSWTQSSLSLEPNNKKT